MSDETPLFPSVMGGDKFMKYKMLKDRIRNLCQCVYGINGLNVKYIADRILSHSMRKGRARDLLSAIRYGDSSLTIDDIVALGRWKCRASLEPRMGLHFLCWAYEHAKGKNRVFKANQHFTTFKHHPRVLTTRKTKS